MRPCAANTFGKPMWARVAVLAALFASLHVMPVGGTMAAAEYRVESWTSDNGLPQNSVNSILQTHDGYLWLATLDGLARFDGVNFTIYDKSNSPGIESNRIISLFEDREGDLWLGTEAGQVTRMHEGRFTTYAQQHGLPPAPVRSITGDEDGNLWVVSANTPMQMRDGRFVSALPEDARPLFDGPNTGWDSRGTSALDAKGIHRFARGRLSLFTVAAGLPSLDVNGVDEDQYGSTWVLVAPSNLVRIDDGRVARTYTARDGIPTLRPKTTEVIDRLVVCRDRKENVWIAGAGPWLGCLRDGALTEYSAPSPSCGSVRALYEDLEGNLWVGTDGGGVLRMREPIVNVMSTEQGLRAGNVYPVFEDRAGAVWVGTWPSGLSRIKEGAVENFSVDDGLLHPLVTTFYEDRTGRLWVGTFGGLQYFDGRRFAVPRDIRVPTRAVFAILQDRHGVFWFGTDHGLVRVDSETSTVFSVKDGLTGDAVKVIHEDQRGVLWIGTDSGLTRVDGGAFSAATDGEGRSIGYVRAIYEDADGALWIGTYDAGLCVLRDGKLTRVTTREGLFDNGVFQILEDDRGVLWMSSNRGIYRVAKRQVLDIAEGRTRAITSISYGKSDGMRSIECNGGTWPAGTKTRDGRLWFPTQDGVAVIDPRSANGNLRPPRVVIETCLVNREQVDLGAPIRIEPGAENFEIHYTGLSFVNSERIEFRYRLVGLDEDWVDAGVRRTAYFTHLPPGEYTFTVLAANSDGVWNTTGASVAIVVVPPFWRTWWFSAIVLLGVASVAIAWHAYRLARMRREHATQAEFARRLMESQESERKRIAAELHDSLGQSLAIIKNRALLVLQRTTDQAYVIEHVREISDASVHAIDEVKEIAQNLRPYQLDRLGLTRAIEGMLQTVADTHDLRVTSELDRIDGLLSTEAETNVFRIIQESVNNVVAHADATGADVLVKRSPRAVEITVRDDGKGFVAGETRGNGSSRRGFGLTGMAERARQIGGVFRVRSAPGQGTTLAITIALEEGRHES